MKRKLLHVLLAFCIVLLAISPSVFIQKVNAATFTNASLTISNSQSAAEGVTYDFAMTTSDTSAIKQMDILFCTTPTGACTPSANMDTSTAILDTENIAGDNPVTMTHPTNNQRIRLVVDNPDDQTTRTLALKFTGITNTDSENTSVYARVTTYSDTGTTPIDNVVVATAVLKADSISVSADVGSAFTFTVAANNVGTVNGSAIGITSTETTIPYGVLAVGVPKTASHEVSVTSNATNGYKVTVNTLADPPLNDGTNNIDKFNATNGSPKTWSSPEGEDKNDNTGFFGYTTEDDELTATGDGADRFVGGKWAGFTDTPEEVIYNAAAPGGSGESTKLGWKAEVNSYQPPGSYTGTIILVATPTY